MMPSWYYNTSSEAKVREAAYFFGSSGKLGFLRHSVTEILETDLEKVVRAKAAEAYRVARVPVIVEHGALCIDFLKGLPGALVKPTWMALGERLCLVVPPGQSRECFALSALCYCDGRKREVIVRRVEGDLAAAPRGTGGFHWDPVFIPKGQTQTLAEMPIAEKLKFSASGQGYAELRQRLGL